LELRALDSRPVLIDQVYERLVDAIAAGALPPGHRLRQELAMLKNAGLVVEQGVRGLVVAPVDPERLHQLFQVRAVLDGLAAGLAAGRVAADPSIDISELQTCIERGLAAELGRDIATAVDWDMRFHAAVNALSGNPVLSEVTEAQRPQIRRVMVVIKFDPAIAERIWREHAGIADAIRAGDVKLDIVIAHPVIVIAQPGQLRSIGRGARRGVGTGASGQGLDRAGGQIDPVQFAVRGEGAIVGTAVGGEIERAAIGRPGEIAAGAGFVIGQLPRLTAGQIDHEKLLAAHGQFARPVEAEGEAFLDLRAGGPVHIFGAFGQVCSGRAGRRPEGGPGQLCPVR
jgi:DNA-binding GntR family transcriptional regulator